jgi:uncharacterized membrane protein
MTYKILLMLHFIFIGLGLGLSASNFVNTRLSLGKSGDMAKGLGLQRKTIAMIGDGVITGIWLSGIALVMYRDGQGLSGWFHAKMAFAILLTIAHVMARRAGGEMLRTSNPALLPRVSLFIAATWLSALAAVILAVMAFEG